MQFYSTLAAVAALVSMVSAQQYTQNPLHAPMGGEVVPAGKEYIIKWSPTTEGRVDLTLKKGKSDDLDTAAVITDGLPNAGLYFWTPDADIEAGDDYAIEIKNAAGDINYTGLFSISSDTKADDKEEDKEKDTDKEEEDKEQEEDKEEEDKTTDAPYPTTTLATSTIAGNSTTTPTGNSTRIPSRTPTAKPSIIDDSEEEPSNTSVPDEDEDTSAAAGVHSSLALVVCVLGAVLYLH
jgi:hypothetical protein